MLYTNFKHPHYFVREKKIGPYRVDFYCPSLKFAVEIDGDSHKDKEEYDVRRDAYLKTFDVVTQRFPWWIVRNNTLQFLDSVKQRVTELENSDNKRYGYIKDGK